MGHVGDLEHLLPQAPLDRLKLRLSFGDHLLYPPRLGYEVLTPLKVALPSDALGQLILLLLQLVQLLYKLRTPVGEPNDQVHVGLDTPVAAVLGDGLGVLTDVSQVEHGSLPMLAISRQLSANTNLSNADPSNVAARPDVIQCASTLPAPGPLRGSSQRVPPRSRP